MLGMFIQKKECIKTTYKHDIEARHLFQAKHQQKCLLAFYLIINLPFLEIICKVKRFDQFKPRQHTVLAGIWYRISYL